MDIPLQLEYITLKILHNLIHIDVLKIQNNCK